MKPHQKLQECLDRAQMRLCPRSSTTTEILPFAMSLRSVDKDGAISFDASVTLSRFDMVQLRSFDQF